MIKFVWSFLAFAKNRVFRILARLLRDFMMRLITFLYGFGDMGLAAFDFLFLLSFNFLFNYILLLVFSEVKLIVTLFLRLFLFRSHCFSFGKRRVGRRIWRVWLFVIFSMIACHLIKFLFVIS